MTLAARCSPPDAIGFAAPRLSWLLLGALALCAPAFAQREVPDHAVVFQGLAYTRLWAAHASLHPDQCDRFARYTDGKSVARVPTKDELLAAIRANILNVHTRAGPPSPNGIWTSTKEDWTFSDGHTAPVLVRCTLAGTCSNEPHAAGGGKGGLSANEVCVVEVDPARAQAAPAKPPRGTGGGPDKALVLNSGPAIAPAPPSAPPPAAAPPAAPIPDAMRERWERFEAGPKQVVKRNYWGVARTEAEVRKSLAQTMDYMEMATKRDHAAKIEYGVVQTISAPVCGPYLRLPSGKIVNYRCTQDYTVEIPLEKRSRAGNVSK